MLQDAVGWDPQNMIVEPSIDEKVYVLFAVVVCCVTIVKLIRIWRSALPFRMRTQATSPGFLKVLRRTRDSLSHWMACMALGWGLLFSTALYNFCNGMLNEKVTGRLVILFAIRELSTSLAMALWIILFVFLVRWHVSNRIERLSD